MSILRKKIGNITFSDIKNLDVDDLLFDLKNIENFLTQLMFWKIWDSVRLNKNIESIEISSNISKPYSYKFNNEDEKDLEHSAFIINSSNLSHQVKYAISTTSRKQGSIAKLLDKLGQEFVDTVKLKGEDKHIYIVRDKKAEEIYEQNSTYLNWNIDDGFKINNITLQNIKSLKEYKKLDEALISFLFQVHTIHINSLLNKIFGEIIMDIFLKEPEIKEIFIDSRKLNKKEYPILHIMGNNEEHQNINNKYSDIMDKLFKTNLSYYAYPAIFQTPTIKRIDIYNLKNTLPSFNITNRMDWEKRLIEFDVEREKLKIQESLAEHNILSNTQKNRL